MKFIVFLTQLSGREEIVVFSRELTHADVAETVRRTKVYDKCYKWHRDALRPVSAGFVNPNLTCYGKSESMNLPSRGDADTKLLKASFR